MSMGLKMKSMRNWEIRSKLSLPISKGSKLHTPSSHIIFSNLSKNYSSPSPTSVQPSTYNTTLLAAAKWFENFSPPSADCSRFRLRAQFLPKSESRADRDTRIIVGSGLANAATKQFSLVDASKPSCLTLPAFNPNLNRPNWESSDSTYAYSTIWTTT